MGESPVETKIMIFVVQKTQRIVHNKKPKDDLDFFLEKIMDSKFYTQKYNFFIPGGVYYNKLYVKVNAP